MELDALANEKLGRMGKMQVGRELKALPKQLMPNEQVQTMAACKLDGSVALMLLTDKRILFVDAGAFGKVKTRDLIWSRITGIEDERGRGLGTISITSHDKTVEISNINPQERYDEIRFAVRERMA